MNLFDVVVLGIIQGLTEFLPISSSGHLVIGQSVLGMTEPGVSLEIWLHVGTLVAVVVYFHRRLLAMAEAVVTTAKTPESAENRRFLWGIIIGTLPAVAAVILLRGYFEQAFDRPRLASLMLVVTGLILLMTYLASDRGKPVGPLRSIAIGIAQAAAILPGISRSGTTIACAMFLGIKPPRAAEFSFLLAVPAIAGAFVYDLLMSPASAAVPGHAQLYFVGALAAFAVGMLAIHLLLKIIDSGRFYLFGVYCLVAGVISFILLP